MILLFPVHSWPTPPRPPAQQFWKHFKDVLVVVYKVCIHRTCLFRPPSLGLLPLSTAGAFFYSFFINPFSPEVFHCNLGDQWKITYAN